MLIPIPSEQPYADWRSILCLLVVILKSIRTNLERTKNVIHERYGNVAKNLKRNVPTTFPADVL